MNKKRKWMTITALTIVALALTACNSQASKTASTKPVSPQSSLGDQQVLANLWYQTSGEAKALYYQGYNIGKMKLDSALSRGTTKKPAVVLDLDETVLDNSPYEAYLIQSGKNYPTHWNNWINRAEAAALPGAVDFLHYADAKGVDIFYISNRKVSQMDATLKNLERIGAPQATKGHVLLQQPNEIGKEARRQQVAQTHDILLYFGDNLSDFEGFDEKSLTERNKLVDQMKNQFGDRFIIFPNPMYGDWEGAIYQFDYKKSDSEKEQLRKSHLSYFKP